MPTEAPCDNSMGTCTVQEDPHVDVFDGVQVSLMGSQAPMYVDSSNDEGAGDKWLVKSNQVSIQARYGESRVVEGSGLFVKGIAIGGPFLKGNVFAVGGLEGQITWNGKHVLEEQESVFENVQEGAIVKAKRSNESSLVGNLSQRNPGVTFELPLNVSLIVNRLQDHVNVAIHMSPQVGGQDGICGNFNGVGSDDTVELRALRFDVNVSPEDSLFVGGILD